MQNPREESDPINRLKNELYARNPRISGHPKPELSSTHVDVEKNWEPPAPFDPFAEVSQKKSHPLLVGSLIFSFVFFAGAAVFAAYTFSRGSNIVSEKNVMLEVAGPSSASAGEPLPLEIVISNTNAAYLDGVKLTVTYPEGTREAVDTNTELPRQEFAIGALAPNEALRKKLDAVVYGEEGTKLSIVADIEYRVRGSSAIFSKKKSFDILLSSSPVSMTVDVFKEVTSGQQFEMVATLTSNSTATLENILLKAEYVSGFTFSVSVPAPTNGNDSWFIGDLRPGEKKVIKIKGKIEGTDGDSRAFRFTVGPVSSSNVRLIGTPLVSLVDTVAIKKPFISLGLSLNDNINGKASVPAGAPIFAHITWTNNLPSRIVDAEITAKLSGPINRNSVSVVRGFYKSSEDIIIWGKADVPSLAVLNPGDSDDVQFNFASLSAENLLALGQGQEIQIEITVKGKRTSETNVPEEIVSVTTGTVRISSNIAFSGRVLYSVGAFKNTGPIPPRADQTTTYTVVWTLTNSLNRLTGVEVKASLPTYVTWLNVTGPSSESIIYDPNSREVVWRAGTLDGGTGFKGTPRIVSFQIAIEPSISQVGTAPTLVGATSVVGKDSYTGVELRDSGFQLNTFMGTDPGYQPGSETVRQ